MQIYCVTVYVKPEFREAFTKATLENALETRKEKGNLRFDFLQSIDDTNRFFLYEVYREDKDVDSHKKTAHYNKWKETIAEMMAKPREGIRHRNLFPVTEYAFMAK